MPLTLTGITVRLGGRVVLDDVDLNVADGEAVALMGPSGAGKTTLLSVVAGTRRPDAGRRTLHRPSASAPSSSGDGASTGDERGPAGGVFERDPGDAWLLEPAWIFQTSPVLMARSALDNVALGPLGRGASWVAARALAADALARVGLERLSEQRVHRLSGGERQRVAIARALASRAGLVVADEPSASLDAANRTTVCNALVALASAGAMVVVATHDQAVADRLDRVVHLDGGRIAHGPAVGSDNDEQRAKEAADDELGDADGPADDERAPAATDPARGGSVDGDAGGSGPVDLAAAAPESAATDGSVG